MLSCRQLLSAEGVSPFSGTNSRRRWRSTLQGDPEQAARRKALLNDLVIFPVTEDVVKLAEAFVVPGGIPPGAAADSVHVASAVLHPCDYLLTWNMRHIANAHIRRMLAMIMERKGHAKPTICTPEELF
jgi:hypothetical protein